MNRLPAASSDTAVRILATTDLGGAFVPVPTSFGRAGTCAGITALLDDERRRQPTIWLDAGDLAVGPVRLLLGRHPWAELAELPLAAAVAGNHEFDDGVPAMLAAARQLPYPLLCANADAGLPASALVGTDDAAVGVIGLTHRASHRFAAAPEPDEAGVRVGRLAADLRDRGARWIVGIVHDGVDWWPEPGRPDQPVGTRTDRLAGVVEPWARHVDVILGGHTPGSWTGTLCGVPAGHPHIFAASVLVVDLPHPPGRPVVRGVHPVPPLHPGRPSPAVDALDAAAGTVVGRSRHTWLSRTGVRHYLPELIAAALHRATGADAAFVPAGQHTTQGAVDGTVAALTAGSITELDLARLFGQADDRPSVASLRPGEFETIRRAVDAVADPRSRQGDHIWWNWCRMPSGISMDTDRPRTVALPAVFVPRLEELIGRDIEAEPAPTGCRQAMAALLR
jgi:hypothetical protein